MKTIKFMILGSVFALMLSACSANENHENTTSTHTPEATASSTEDSMRDDVTDGADAVMDGTGDVIDGAGDVVRDAGDAVGDAADDIGGAIKSE